MTLMVATDFMHELLFVTVVTGCKIRGGCILFHDCLFFHQYCFANLVMPVRKGNKKWISDALRMIE